MYSTTGYRFEPRYKQVATIGTKFGDKLGEDATFHKLFNWRANVRRDLVLHGGVPSAGIISWHMCLTEYIKGKEKS